MLAAGPGEEFVRLLIRISTGGESAGDGDEAGLGKGRGCARGDVGDAGDVE